MTKYQPKAEESSDSDKESSHSSSSSSSSSSSRGGETSNVKKKRSGSSKVRNSESTSDDQELNSRSREAASPDNSNTSNEDGVMVNRIASSGESDEVMVSEDAGREDMFEDAPEDLGVDGRESSGAYTEPRDGSDAEQQHIQFRGLDNGLMQNDYMVDEMERLRAVLDKTLNEKESLTREYKDDVDMAAHAIANLRDQMRGLVSRDGSVNIVHDGDLMGLGSQAPLHQVIHECSMFLRELQSTIHEKDREIGELNKEATEVYVSREVVDSYMNSVQGLSLEARAQNDQYLDESANRMIGSLASVVYAEELQDNSVVGKFYHIEKHLYVFVENYNWFLSQTELLRQSLAEVRPDIGLQNDYSAVFTTAGSELFELRKKESELLEKLGYLESENSKSMAELEKHKAAAEAVDAEFERVKAELEQERNRYMNTKEKLSLAVTKGKALVQQRDSLKQSLADKTSELEKCLVELQEKATALESAELVKEEWVKSQVSVASLQEELSQRDAVLAKLEEVLSQETAMPEGLKEADIAQRFGWLVDERNALKDVSLKFHQLADALLSIDLPENFSFSDLESRLGWLTESFNHAKADIAALQDTISRTRESAQTEMDELSATLSTALVEKDCLQLELEDMMHKLEASNEKEHQVSSEKEQVLRMLLEASGIEDVPQESSSTAILVEQCLGNINQRSGSALESSKVKAGKFERMQGLLYVRVQELLLCEQLLEEERLKESQLNNLLIDLRKSSEDVSMLRDETSSLKKDLERSEEKNALIREKLSMAVKKGKGLVQERENMKQLIGEKNTEIEKLKNELLQLELALAESKDENSKLSADLAYIPKLEDDLSVLKDQREQLEKDLSEINRLLQTLMSSIDGIVPQLDSGFSEPVQKLNQLAGYLSDCQAAKTTVEQELEKSKVETETLSCKLGETNSTIKSLEDALAAAENKISQLIEEKSILEASKLSTEEQLEKTIEESLSHSDSFTEVTTAKSLLENALSSAENDLSRLRKEKEEVETSKAHAEAELLKVNEEVIVLTGKLAEMESSVSMLAQEKREAETSKATAEADLVKMNEEFVALTGKLAGLESSVSMLTQENHEAYSNKSSVEVDFMRAKEEVINLTGKLAEVESNISILRKEKEEAESDRATAEAELASMKEEVTVLTSTLEEASISNKSLEDAVFQLESRIALLTEENNDAQTRRSSMESDLNKFKEQATAWDHKLQESFSTIKSLEEALAKAENNLSVLAKEKQVAQEEISALNAKLNSCMEELAGKEGSVEKSSLELFGYLNDLEALIAGESITTLLRKAYEDRSESMKGMDLLFKNIKQLAESSLESQTVPEEISCLTKCLSTNIDDILGAEPESCEVDATKIEDISLHLHVQKMVEKFQMRFRTFAEKINGFASFMNEYDSSVLQGLQATKDMVSPVVEQADYLKQKVETTQAQRHALEQELTTLKTGNSAMLSVCAGAAQELHFEADKHSFELGITPVQELLIQSDIEGSNQAATENLLSAARRVCCVLDLSEKSRNGLKSTVEELQFKLNESKETLESMTGERNLYFRKFSSLQAELEEQQNLCNELRLKLEDYHAIELKLNDKEAEIASLHSSFSVKEREAGEALLQASQMTNILDKVKVLELSLAEQRGEGLGIKDSDQLSKLLYIVDRFPELQHQVAILSKDKEELQSTVSEQLLELDRLKKLLNNTVGNEQTLAGVRSELDSLVEGIEIVIQRLGGRDFVGQKFVNTKQLVEVLEKLVAAVIVDLESSKSKASELDAKLIGSQNFVDELSSKVRVLEDSLQAKAAPSDTVHERSIFEAPSVPSTSEISEVEDAAPLSKPTVSPVPSAAHVRAMRKGSSDHIALDVESERLIDTREVDRDEDKGHVFKSLNTSGLVPRQGKLYADKVDGVWVTGSRVLMGRPRARLGLIAYWLLLHIWLLGTIL